MRLAIFSDVHANLPALEAVYKHATEQRPDAIYCLGDLVNQNVWNNEVIEFIHAHDIPCVLGNHDEGIGNNKPAYPFSYGSREEIEWGLEAIAYTSAQVTEENKKILRSFPLKRELKLETGFGLYKLLLAHGTPATNKKRIYHSGRQADFYYLFQSDKENALLIGNTHCVLDKTITVFPGGSVAVYNRLINPGSVGCPKDGSWHACYAILDIDTTKDLFHDPAALSVRFFRLDYDIDKVIKAIKHSPLSMYYAGRLLKY